MFDRPDSNQTQSRPPGAPYTASDLPVDEQGRIYHLQIQAEQIAPDILIVGDPGRAQFIGSTFLRDIELEHEHRGLVTVTGTYEQTGERATIVSPLRTTVATSGMGTPSLEIVVSELVALTEIDLNRRTRKPKFPRLHVIRVGTSGALQTSTALGVSIITSYAIGMNSTGFFYQVPYPDDDCRRLEAEVGELVRRSMSPESRFYGKIYPYVSRAEPALVDALAEAAARLGVPAKVGLTVSCSGFFAPQGRDIARIKPSLPDVDQVFSEYDPRLDGQRVENMEMEASFLIHYLCGLGHWAGVICPIIAHRREDTFDPHYQDAIANATRVALEALAAMRKRDPGVPRGGWRDGRGARGDRERFERAMDKVADVEPPAYDSL
jgi:uridine phosphorylase